MNLSNETYQNQPSCKIKTQWLMLPNIFHMMSAFERQKAEVHIFERAKLSGFALRGS